jgi:GTP-binding protein HflX
VPYDRGDIVSILHSRGVVTATDYVEGGTHLTARIAPADESLVAEFRVPIGA